MTENDTDTKERIDAIPESAYVLGIDAKGRIHLHDMGDPDRVWVVVDSSCEHYKAFDGSIASWIDYTAEHIGWKCRHFVERPAFAGLFEDKELPPTRAEVLKN